MGLPWLGFIFGYIVAIIFRQNEPDIRAIAIETGIQNTGIAIFLLRFSLKQPAADMTTGKFLLLNNKFNIKFCNIILCIGILVPAIK